MSFDWRQPQPICDAGRFARVTYPDCAICKRHPTDCECDPEEAMKAGLLAAGLEILPPVERPSK